MKKQSIPIYLYVKKMAIEGTRPECCWHIIKTASYFPNDTPNAVVTYKFWRNDQLTVVDPNWSRYLMQ